MSIEPTNIKITAASSSENKALLVAKSHFVKQPETLHLERGLLALANAAFADRQLVNLTIVLPDLLLPQVVRQTLSAQVACNAVSIGAVGFLNPVRDARVLRQIAVRVLNRFVRVNLLQTIEERPPHDSHKGLCPHGSSALELQIDPASVICLVARLAERYEVVGGISACAPAFDVMHVQDRVSRLPSAVLTLVTITPKNILAHVPEAELFTLLILRALNVRVLYSLHIEARGFHRDLRYRKEPADILDKLQVRSYFVLDRRCKPALVLAVNTIAESWRTIAGLAIAASTPKSQARRLEIRDVVAQYGFTGIELGLFGGSREADVPVAGVNSKRDILPGFARCRRELNRKGSAALHACLPFPQQHACLCRRAWH